MKLLLSLAVAIACLSGSVCQAGFLSAYTGVTGTGGPPNTRSVRYTVWQNTSSVASLITGSDNVVLANSPLVGAGQFAYLYQVLSPANPFVSTYNVNVDAARTTQIGVASDSVFSGATTFGVSTNARNVSVSNADASGVFFTIAPSVTPANPSPASEIMYIVSSGAPTLGLGDFGPTSTSSQIPVPVPLPATLGLVALGLPFIGSLRRRISR